MPTNKREELLFTILMCAIMVFVMTVYNEMRIFGVTRNLIAESWLGFPLAFIVGMCLDWFIVSHFASFMRKKFTKEDSPAIKQILTISLSMVFGMVFFMSLFGAILTVGISPLLFKLWFINIPYNLVVALPLQLLIAGPLVRYIFGKIVNPAQVQHA